MYQNNTSFTLRPDHWILLVISLALTAPYLLVPLDSDTVSTYSGPCSTVSSCSRSHTAGALAKGSGVEV